MGRVANWMGWTVEFEKCVEFTLDIPSIIQWEFVLASI